MAGMNNRKHAQRLAVDLLAHAEALCALSPACTAAASAEVAMGSGDAGRKNSFGIESRSRRARFRLFQNHANSLDGQDRDFALDFFRAL